MVKKKEISRKHETGKKEKHTRKQDELKALDSRNSRGQGKMKPDENGLKDLTGPGKGNKNGRDFEKGNKQDNGNYFPQGSGIPGGIGLGIPDLSVQLGKAAKGKGCLSKIFGNKIGNILGKKSGTGL